MDQRRDLGQWGEGLRSMLEVQEREDRERAASMSVAERLELGVQLSLFSARLRGAFHDQTAPR